MRHSSPLLCYLGEPTRVPERLGDTHLKSPSSLEHLSFDISVFWGRRCLVVSGKQCSAGLQKSGPWCPHDRKSWPHCVMQCTGQGGLAGLKEGGVEFSASHQSADTHTSGQRVWGVWILVGLKKSFHWSCLRAVPPPFSEETFILGCP